MERYQEIERSIIKTYRGRLWAPFIKAVKEYELIKPNDKICVCISGGKDSMLMAKLFQELKRHSDFEFEVKYLVMNPGYNEMNLNQIKKNIEILYMDKNPEIFSSCFCSFISIFLLGTYEVRGGMHCGFPEN